MDQGPDQGLQQHGLEGEDGMQVGSSKLLNLTQWPLKCPSIQVPSLKQQLHYVVRQITAFKTMATKEAKLPSKCEKMVQYQNFEVAGDKLRCDQCHNMLSLFPF